MDREVEGPCPGCEVLLPIVAGPTHAYIGASPACWARFGEVLAREYQEPAWFRAHQITVDAYAAQHPGVPERRSVQSVALHLMTLGMVLERGLDSAVGPVLHKRMSKRPEFRWLEPPSMAGRMTVLDVLGARDPDEHGRLVRDWGKDVWAAWAAHHSTVRSWVDQSLASGDAASR